jgi:molybdenum cofactor guanylyltransferase
MKKNILGVVMCGGQSSRMGNDKGMLMSEGTTWAKLAFNKFKDLSIPAIISVNTGQLTKYKESFPEDLLLADCIDTHGSLKGVLSVHKNFPQHDLFLLACDLKDLGTECLHVLYKSWESDNNSFDSFLFKNQDQYEPLAGIYTSKFLSEVFLLNQRKGITDYSMMSMIKRGQVFEIKVTDQMKPHFRNYNMPNEVSD